MVTTPDRIGEASELEALTEALLPLDPTGARVARVLRNTFDQLYDGQRTGRWRFDQLHKTEKTHMGTLVEINLQREFGFDDGDATDFRIGGIEVDCKYSMTDGAWTLPPEVVGHWTLLLTANDEHATWKGGLLKVRPELLNAGRNRDAKATLSHMGRAAVMPLWPGNMRLAPNVFYTLDRAEVDRVFRLASGQARVNQLFRIARGRIIRRAALATVAQQDDSMKRARANGGARDHLRPEGIIILGHYPFHQFVAERLGLPVPQTGELVSARVCPAQPGPGTVEINGQQWRLATSRDAIITAPLVEANTPPAASATT